jgi:hypothetical protein
MYRRLFFFLFNVGWLALSASALFAKDITWTNGAGNMTWDTVSLNWKDSSENPALYVDGDNVTFGDTGVGTVTLVAGPLSPGNITVNSTGTYAFNGPDGSLIGSPTMTLPGHNPLRTNSLLGNCSKCLQHKKLPISSLFRSHSERKQPVTKLRQMG